MQVTRMNGSMCHTAERGDACAGATADEQAGSYVIRMSSGIAGGHADFNANNLAGPVAGLEAIFGDDQSADVGTQFPDWPQVRATDAYGTSSTARWWRSTRRCQARRRR